MKRKIYKLLSGTKQVLLALALAVFSGKAYSQVTYTLNYTGSIQTLTLLAGVYDVKMWGADGGNSNNSRAGIGGYSNGTLTLVSTTTVFVVVGGSPLYTGFTGLQPAGYNGGGTGYANGTGRAGGGATHMATATGTLGALSTNTSAVIMVAGGGGGDQNAGLIGHGGGLTGGGTYPGTQTGSSGGIFGSFGQGGDITTSYGGGGGGGWYGGGGNQNNAGSGGSGYIGGVTNGVTTMSAQSGFVTKPIVAGDGLVIITELCSITLYAAGNTSSLNPVLCAGQSATLVTNAVSNYSWSTGATTSSIVVAPTTSTVYGLTATSSLACSATRNISVTVSSGPPILSISNPSPNICLGRTATLTASGAVIYSWTGGIQNGITFTPTATQVYTVTGTNGCGSVTSTATISVAPLPVSAAVTPTIVCQGSLATLSASSAVTGYTWAPMGAPGASVVVSPTAQTVYTVTASDGTCSGVATVTLATKTTPTVIASGSSTMICENGSLTLNASGAQSYVWTPGNATGASVVVNPTVSTLYQVAGTNSLGCTAYANYPIVVNAAPSVTALTNKPMVCVGGTAVLTALGASTYTWVNGPQSNSYTVNPTAPTVYTVDGTGSNTCVGSKTVMVNVYNPVINVTPVSTGICPGGQVLLTAIGATSYSWNGTQGISQMAFSPTITTIYLVTANTLSAGVSCQASVSATITVFPVASISVTATKTTMCKGEKPALLTASGGTTYLWSNAANTSTTNASASNSGTISYNVTATDANGCEGSTSISIYVNPCIGIAEEKLNGGLSVYPNPSDGTFNITSNTDMMLILSNQLGQQLRSIELHKANGFTAEVKDLTPGIYFISDKNSTNLAFKIVVN